MDPAVNHRIAGREKSKKLIDGRSEEWLLRDALARRYHYRGPFDPLLEEALNHPVKRPLLYHTATGIPDADRQMTKTLLQALDILGAKLLTAMGVEGVDHIFDLGPDSPSPKQLPLEQRPVKFAFRLPDGRLAKVV